MDSRNFTILTTQLKKEKEKDSTFSDFFITSFLKEVGTASIESLEAWPYIEEPSSLYQPSFEIQNLKSITNVLTDRINALYQVIQNLQKRKIIPIQNLRSTKLQLRDPLYVVSEYEDGVFVIFSDDINLYGHGDTELNAIRDFCKDVKYLYFDLKQSKEKLGEIMKENWEFLKNIIIEL